VHQLAAPGALRPRVVEAYRDDGLVVIGVHTPEFSFEHEVDRVRQPTKERGIDYPVAVDNNYEIWSAFDNHYGQQRQNGTQPLSQGSGTPSRARRAESCSKAADDRSDPTYPVWADLSQSACRSARHSFGFPVRGCGLEAG
jgi:hypothetical protein